MCCTFTNSKCQGRKLYYGIDVLTGRTLTYLTLLLNRLAIVGFAVFVIVVFFGGVPRLMSSWRASPVICHVGSYGNAQNGRLVAWLVTS